MMKRKGLLRLSFLFAMTIIVLCSSGVGAESSNFLLYRDPAGFSIRYPENWTVRNQSKATVDFQSPWENANDDFREYVSVTYIDLEHRMNMKQVTDYMIDYLSKYITDFNLLWQDDAYLSDENAVMISYTGRQGQFRFRWKHIWTIKNNRIYAVTYRSESEKYEKYMDIAERMFSSFQIGNND